MFLLNAVFSSSHTHTHGHASRTKRGTRAATDISSQMVDFWALVDSGVIRAIDGLAIARKVSFGKRSPNSVPNLPESLHCKNSPEFYGDPYKEKKKSPCSYGENQFLCKYMEGLIIIQPFWSGRNLKPYILKLLSHVESLNISIMTFTKIGFLK